MPTISQMSIADQIRLAVLRDKRTQQELAALVGCNAATIGRFMRGRNLRADTLDRLAAAVNVRVYSDRLCISTQRFIP